MIEEMIEAVVRKLFSQSYPYLNLPAVVFARIETSQQSGSWYEYRLTILDRFGNIDPKYPTLPGIKSKNQFRTGAVVAVALPYGDLTPAIIGEVEL